MPVGDTPAGSGSGACHALRSEAQGRVTTTLRQPRNITTAVDRSTATRRGHPEPDAQLIAAPTLDGRERADATPDTPVSIDPDQLWRVFAAELAGRPRVRLAVVGRKYVREARLASRPDYPAAVCLYSHAGAARALAVDLDVSRGGRDQVLADSQRLQQLLTAVGARVIIDESPSGGRHVWVPLVRPRTATELRRVVRAIAGLCPSSDIAPMSNPVAGCLRPPGAAHPLGGHQQLLTPWAEAVDAVRERTTDAAWLRLLDHLGPELADVDTQAAAVDVDVDVDVTVRGGGARPLPAVYDQIARSGRFDRAKYASPSEARIAVLDSAAAHGWSLVDVQRALRLRRWPGLASFYTKYRAGPQRQRALAADWRAALRYSKLHARQPKDLVVSSVSISHTGEKDSRGGSRSVLSRPAVEHVKLRPGASSDQLSDYVYVRVWTTAVQLAVPSRWVDRAGLSRRAVLRALAEAAHRRGSRYVDVGTRSLGLGSVLDHSTVAQGLKALRAEADPFIVLIKNRRGARGDLYELRIPDEFREQAGSLPWPKGRLSGLHPVFHQLGVPAALLYDAVQQGGPADAGALMARTHLSRATVYRAAAALSDHGLLRATGGAWRKTRLKLSTLARRLHVPSLVDQLLQRIREERRQWHAFLGLVGSFRRSDPQHILAELASAPPPPEPPPEPPPTPLQLLMDLLGAVPIPPGTGV